MNSTKGAKNIFWGLMAQIITIGVGVLIPRLVLVNLGSESNGLMNSVSSVLTYLSLLEAGVGTATIQALYEPIERTDRDSINRIMSATHFFLPANRLCILGTGSCAYGWIHYLCGDGTA